MEKTTRVRDVVRQIARNYGLILGSLLVAVLLFEVLLRVMSFSHPTFWVPDPVLGGKLRPNAKGIFSKEGRSYVQTNSLGFRDREWESNQASRQLRIAVLGDSYTEAVQVEQSQTFCRVAERNLRAEFPAKNIEVMNFGVSGYGTAQELILFREVVRDFAPSIVVVAFLSGNDVRNNSKALEPKSRPFFELREGELVLDNSFRESDRFKRQNSIWWQAVAKMSNNFRILQLANKVRQGISARRQAKLTVNDGAEKGIDNMVYLEPNDTLWSEAWSITEALILQLSKEVDGIGARFLTVSLTNASQVYPDRADRERYMEENGLSTLTYPEDRLSSFCAEEKIPFFSLVGPMSEAAVESGECLHGFSNAIVCGGHWNEKGHELAGDLISERLSHILKSTGMSESESGN